MRTWCYNAKVSAFICVLFSGRIGAEQGTGQASVNPYMLEELIENEEIESGHIPSARGGHHA